MKKGGVIKILFLVFTVVIFVYYTMFNGRYLEGAQNNNSSAPTVPNPSSTVNPRPNCGGKESKKTKLVSKEYIYPDELTGPLESNNNAWWPSDKINDPNVYCITKEEGYPKKEGGSNSYKCKPTNTGKTVYVTKDEKNCVSLDNNNLCSPGYKFDKTKKGCVKI